MFVFTCPGKLVKYCDPAGELRGGGGTLVSVGMATVPGRR